jgi:FKBP-type peptidyl-prolyl cis-trans isomerase
MRKGVKVEDIRVGEGAEATLDSVVRIRYDGYLNRGDPFQLNVACTIDLAHRDIIAGLRYGIEGMRTGGRRRIRVSPHLAYGAGGASDCIPANAVLIFDVELIEVLGADLER